MNVAYLLTGGNTGNRLHYLNKAAAEIKDNCGTIVSKSSVYETAPWGVKEQNSFLNQALKLLTPLFPEDLLDNLLQIEERLGRIRKEKYGPRIIDIDILLFNDDVIDARHLKIPHPELTHRRFALQCLNDIAADKIHPVFKKKIAQILKECNDPLSVDKFR